jgi:hypothetical protein
MKARMERTREVIALIGTFSTVKSDAEGSRMPVVQVQQ